MPVSAGQVKALRERTGAGMMDCKRALQAANGDMDLAIDQMRKAGVVKAVKRLDRVAREGVIAIRSGAEQAVILEVNSETDFVARETCFRHFVDLLSASLLTNDVTQVQELLALQVDGKSLSEHHQDLVARIGENIVVRRFQRMQGRVGSYLHGHRIGVLVAIEGGDAELLNDIALHIAASNPLVIHEHDVQEQLLARERAVYAEQEQRRAEQEQRHGRSRPPEIMERSMEGKIRKFVKTVSLLEQEFVKDDNKDKADKRSVRQLLEQAQASVQDFVRFELGEGLEKDSGNFVGEVMAQAGDGGVS